MYKDGVLTISDFGKGAANSPIEGFGHMEGVEIFDTPGVVKIANAVSGIGPSFTGLCVSTVKDIYGNYYFLTNDGKLYVNFSGTPIQTGLGTVYDMVIAKDFLFVRHSTVISIYGPLAGPAVWYGNWSSNGSYLSGTPGGFSASNYGKMVVAGDPDTLTDSIFLANGNRVVKLKSLTTGTPLVATYDAGLALPDGRYATTLVSMGDKIFVGAGGGSTWATRNNYKVADIYPWDKVSADAYSLPVRLNESGIQAMITDNNKLYVVAGTNGNIYVTDSTNYLKLRRLPWVQSKGFNQSMQVYPNAIAFNNAGNLLIGTSTLQDSYSTDTSHQSFHGIYEVNVNALGYPTVLKHTAGSSGGLTGATTALTIGSIFSGSDDSIIFGWQSGSTYGINLTNFYCLTGYIESPLIIVGSRIAQKTFQQIEFNLVHPLKPDAFFPTTADGQTISIYYRETLDASYSLIGTYTYKNLGSVIGFNDKAKMADLQQVQIKIVLTQPISSLATDNINLLNVRIW